MTNHATDRARQRGIHDSVLQLVLDEGRPLRGNRDRVLLTALEVEEAYTRGRIDPVLYRRGVKASPLVGVVRSGRLITVFRPTKGINRSKGKRNRRSKWS